MQRLSSTTQLLMLRRAPAPIRWCRSALSQPRHPVTAARCPLPHRSPRIHQGYQHMAKGRGVKSEESGATDERSLFPSAIDRIRASNDNRIFLGKHFPITKEMKNEENRGGIQELFPHYDDVPPANGEYHGRKTMDVIHSDKNSNRTTVEVSTDCKRDTKKVRYGLQDLRGQSASKVSYEGQSLRWPAEDFTCHHDDGVPRVHTLPLSSHCDDGSMNKEPCYYKRLYHLADRNETRLEAMMFSDPSRHCVLNGGTCLTHRPRSMWQIFSLKLSKIQLDCGSVELYGYFAARDMLDPLLNYIINISRDDAAIVQQGSLIEMTGPKRAIDFSCAILIEYDMRIKRGERKEDDLRLIDGAAVMDEKITISTEPYTKRIHGNYGAVDMNQMALKRAMEATIEVAISEVQCNFELCVSCFTSGLHEEIRLFDGMIGESRGLRRHVIAVKMGTSMDLKFKIGSGSYCAVEHCRSFQAASHGCSSQTINMELASILVKVAWSTLPRSWPLD